jgi:transposase
LRDRGIEYANPDSVGQLFRRRKAKLKTGRPQHEKADPQEQEAFKKTSPIGEESGATESPTSRA